MRAHQPGSTPIDIPETVPNPAYTPAPAPERSPTKVPEKVPEKVISGIAEVTATSNGGLNPKLLIWPRQTPTIPGSLLALAVGCSAVQLRIAVRLGPRFGTASSGSTVRHGAWLIRVQTSSIARSKAALAPNLAPWMLLNG